MDLLSELSAHRAIFYFVEKEGIAYEGSWELIATIAHWYRPGDPFAPLPDVLPVWQGSYLPFQEAFDRWGLPEVWVVSVGCSSPEARHALTKHVKRSYRLRNVRP